MPISRASGSTYTCVRVQREPSVWFSTSDPNTVDPTPATKDTEFPLLSAGAIEPRYDADSVREDCWWCVIIVSSSFVDGRTNRTLLLMFTSGVR